MNIIFPPQEEKYINNLIAKGVYATPTEFVLDAVRRLRKEESQRHDRLMAALEEGEQAIRDGDYEPYTQELFERICKDALADAKAGIKPNPDVCP